jgi:uncharacterized repeat protein (TIGR01451 family)
MNGRRLVVMVVLVIAALNALAIIVLGSPRDGCPGYGSFSGSGAARAGRAGGGLQPAGYSGFSGYSGYFCSQADLRIDVTDHPDPALAGGRVSYRATVANKGPDIAFDVFVEHYFDRDARILTVDAPPDADCETYAYFVYCTLPLLRVHQHADVTVTVSIPLTMRTSTDETFTYSEAFDPDFHNNHDPEQTRIAPSADLMLTKLDAPDPVHVRDVLTYSLVVRNRGPARATDVALTDPLPVGLQVLQVSTTRGSCSVEGSLVSCDLGTLEKDDLVTVTILTRPLGPGTLTNTATATSTMADPIPTNNRSNQVTQVIA